MSHIHLPDGVLPVWLWISGWIAIIVFWAIIVRMQKKRDLSRRLPLLGMMSAAMVLGASVEIVPIAYHINLTVIAGILVGPSLIFIGTLVVNVILALFGHGGITVIGLNTLILSLEGIFGYFLFHLFWRVLHRLTAATFLATFLALLLSTLAMIGAVSLGISHYETLIHQEKGRGMLEFKFLKEKEDHSEQGVHDDKVSLKRFVAVLLPLSFLGWILEGIITALMIRYIHRLRPDLLKLESRSP